MAFIKDHIKFCFMVTNNLSNSNGCSRTFWPEDKDKPHSLSMYRPEPFLNRRLEISFPLFLLQHFGDHIAKQQDVSCVVTSYLLVLTNL